MAGYCSVTDLKLGNIPMPSYIDKQQEVDNAAEEIDAKIGFKYSTPINITQGTTTLDRPAILLLKQINAFIATGRILMAVDAAGEDEQVHAYANRLLKEAYAALDAIVAGTIELTGAVLNDTDPKPGRVVVNNIDDESLVEAFYDRIANPRYTYPSYIPTVNGGYVL